MIRSVSLVVKLWSLGYYANMKGAAGMTKEPGRADGWQAAYRDASAVLLGAFWADGWHVDTARRRVYGRSLGAEPATLRGWGRRVFGRMGPDESRSQVVARCGWASFNLLSGAA